MKGASRVVYDSDRHIGACGPPARQLLMAIMCIIAILRTANGVQVTSFAELRLAVDSGLSPISVECSQMIFPRCLIVRESTQLHVDGQKTTGTLPTTLSGGDSTRLFFLHNSSLSLSGLQLTRGRCAGCNGGAIYMSPGSELLLRSVLMSANQAIDGAAIFALSAAIIATNCTMSGNAASRGGVFSASGNSTVTATDCTMNSNSAIEGGAVFALGDATVTTADCTVTSNSVSYWGGAYAAQGSSTVIVANCLVTSNSASSFGGAVY